MKLIAIAAASLDGFITQGNQPSAAFTSEEDKKWFSEVLKSFPVKVMGRKTFEVSREYVLKLVGDDSTDLRLVLTRSPEFYQDLEKPGRLQFTDGTPSELLEIVRNSGHAKSQVAILGGSPIYTAFLQDGLLDEFWLTLEPKLFGSGTPLVQARSATSLQLKESIKLGPSTMLLKYSCRTNKS